MADMRLNRRTFLQQAGLTLFTLGITETGISVLGRQGKLKSLIQPYLQTLAQTTNRKLALLIGINQYPHKDDLHGCVTDVELQRELLIHRFGFQPNDILTITDRQATRETIETAFVEHLIQQAKAEDVVVFHFSGYGGQVQIPSLSTQTMVEEEEASTSSAYELVNSLIPADGISSAKNTSVANNLSPATLNLLGRSLATEKFTTILDTSFSLTQKLSQHNLPIRSLGKIADSFSPEELSFQEQLQTQAGSKLLRFDSKNLSIPGIILSAAEENQVAAEFRGDNFSAGLFTYALTQYLWQVTSASKVTITLQKTAEKVEGFIGTKQKPQFKGKNQPLFTYYLIPDRIAGAEGFLTGKENNGTLDLKLVGLPIKVLDNYGVNSCFSLVSADTSTIPKSIEKSIWLQIRSREGLKAKVQPLNQANSSQQLKIGQLVQELIRVFPRDLGLVMALDTSLERIERVDATSAFANVDVVDSVTIKGEQNADYLLGKITKNLSEKASSDSTEKTDSPATQPETGDAYSLFSLSGDVMPKTIGVANEAVKSAVKRLNSQLKALMAMKWLDLTVNEGSSLLGVKVALESVEPENTLLRQKTTFRAIKSRAKLSKLYNRQNSTQKISADSTVPTVANGSQLQFRINNYHNFPLYAMLLGLDADGDAIALLTPQVAQNPEDSNQIKNIEIAPKQELILPHLNNSINWRVASSAGIAKVYLVFATAPFTKTISVLSTKQNLKLEKEQVINMSNPLQVTEALLEDLHAASAVKSEMIGSNANIYAWDVRNWATISFVYEIV